MIPCYRYEMKLLYQLHLVFSYAVVVCILFLLIRKICTTPNEYRSQYSVIVVGLLAVIGINAVFLFIPGDSVFSLLDYSICCYSLMSFLIYWNCFDYSTHAMLNKMKNRIFENIGQGIVLFDHENNRILHNKRAEVLLGREKLEHCGRLDEFMKQYELPVLKLGETNSYTVQCRVEENEKRQSLRCDVKMLRNEKGTRLGLMFVFSDIAVETDLQTGFQKWENFLPMTREAGEHFLFPVGIAVCDVNSLSVINATRGQDANLIAICSCSDETRMAGYAERVSQTFNGSIQYGISVASDKDQSMEKSIRSAMMAMRTKKLVDGESIHSDMLSSLLKALEECDSDTEHHIERTRLIGAELGKKIGLSDAQQSKLALLCLLHDIGKISIPIEILNKPGKLTDREWKIMRLHVEAGYEIANSNAELKQVANEIRSHHERWDGKGYPDGLSKESIPLLSRVISVIDSYDAMTNDRPYRKGMPVEAAMEELRRNAGTQFDPSITAEFIEFLSEKYSVSLA